MTHMQFPCQKYGHGQNSVHRMLQLSTKSCKIPVFQLKVETFALLISVSGQIKPLSNELNFMLK